MGNCNSGGCGSSSKTSVGGCRNNGTCGTSGCNKMNVFDWLGNMAIPAVHRFPIIEIKFKGGRKEFYRNPHGLQLVTGDPVVVDVQKGFHIGYVSLQGELVRLQMRKYKVKDNEAITDILRIADSKDLQKLEQAQHREMPTLYRTREIIKELGIRMKLSDVEFQADNSKATFFYSADSRVDFRELIKILATEFRVRIEMRQISLRQEAGRIGGIGSCGRELCCSTWLSDFRSVSTSAARYQNLSLNPTKLSGQCGRLKCCLNYELETYIEALKDIPQLETFLKTEKGEVKLQKTDIFKKIMWFSYDTENTWYPLTVEQVSEYVALNRKGILIPELGSDKNNKKNQPVIQEEEQPLPARSPRQKGNEFSRVTNPSISPKEKIEDKKEGKKPNRRKRGGRGKNPAVTPAPVHKPAEVPNPIPVPIIEAKQNQVIMAKENEMLKKQKKRRFFKNRNMTQNDKAKKGKKDG